MTQSPRSRGTPGKGLAALIPDDVMDASPPEPSEPGERGVLRVPLDLIQPNPEQPRVDFDPAALEELSASIREHGVLSPLVVRPRPGGGYVLIAGERRLRASGLAGLAEVPVVVRVDAASPEVQLELALVENLQREDLNAVEAARGFARLQQEFGYTQEHIARKVGKDRATVANALRMLKLPEAVLRLVQDGRLSAAHARALLPLEDEAAQREVVAQILSRELSVRAVEALVRARLAGPRRGGRPARQDPAYRYAGELLTRALNTAVRIQPRSRGQGGSIQIDYYTPEDLERLIKRIRGEE